MTDAMKAWSSWNALCEAFKGSSNIFGRIRRYVSISKEIYLAYLSTKWKQDNVTKSFSLGKEIYFLMCFYLCQIFHVSACWVIQHFFSTQDKNEYKTPPRPHFTKNLKPTHQPTNQPAKKKPPTNPKNPHKNKQTNKKLPKKQPPPTPPTSVPRVSFHLGSNFWSSKF